MKRYDELPKLIVDTKLIQERIEYLFFKYIRMQSDLNKWFLIDADDINILCKDFSFAQNYVREFGYELEVSDERLDTELNLMRFVTINK